MTTSTLAGKSVVLTGKLDQLGMLREEAIRALNQRGAYVQDAVDDGTDFLVQGRPPGRETVKARRARALGIPVIDQRDFAELLERVDTVGERALSKRAAIERELPVRGQPIASIDARDGSVHPPVREDRGLGDILADLAARERRDEREW